MHKHESSCPEFSTSDRYHGSGLVAVINALAQMTSKTVVKSAEMSFQFLTSGLMTEAVRIVKNQLARSVAQ